MYQSRLNINVVLADYADYAYTGSEVHDSVGIVVNPPREFPELTDTREKSKHE